MTRSVETIATAMRFFIFRLSCQLPDGVNLNTAGAGYKPGTHGRERQAPGDLRNNPDANFSEAK